MSLYTEALEETIREERRERLAMAEEIARLRIALAEERGRRTVREHLDGGERR